MDTPTLVGTGFFILAAVVWVVCVLLCYQTAPKFGRGAVTWAILGVIFGPIALMILYILPKHEPAARPRSPPRGPAGRAVREAQEALVAASARRRSRVPSTDAVTSDTARSMPDIRPMRSLGLLSVAHAVNHAQAVVLPLIFLAIIEEYGVGVEAIAFLAATGAFLSGMVQLSYAGSDPGRLATATAGDRRDRVRWRVRAPGAGHELR